MPAEFLLDTNVFIYHLDDSDARKQGIAEELVTDALASGSGCISSQVVVECLNVVLRRGQTLLDSEGARSYFRSVLHPLWRDVPLNELILGSVEIRERYRVHFFDSLVIASAIHLGCDVLYSEDLQHGQRFGSLLVTNPFLD